MSPPRVWKRTTAPSGTAPGPSSYSACAAASVAWPQRSTSKPLRVNHRRSYSTYATASRSTFFVLSPADDREATESAGLGGFVDAPSTPSSRDASFSSEPASSNGNETRLFAFRASTSASPSADGCFFWRGGGRILTNAVSLRCISRATSARNVSGGNPSLPASAVRAGIRPRVHTTASFAACRCLKSSASAVFSLGNTTTAAGFPRNFTVVNASTVT